MPAHRAAGLDRPIFWWAKAAGALWLTGAYVRKWVTGGKNPVVAGNPFDQGRPIVYETTAGPEASTMMPMGLPIDFVGVAPKGLGNCGCD